MKARFAILLITAAMALTAMLPATADYRAGQTQYPEADAAPLYLAAAEEPTAAPAEEAAAPAPEESAEQRMAAARDNVWWGNRSISYGNYIRFERGEPCVGRCKYCDKDLIDCETGCPCAECEYICDDCDNCPPTYFDKIYFDPNKAVLRPQGLQECMKAARYLQEHPEAMLVIEGLGGVAGQGLELQRTEAVRRCLIEHGVAAHRISVQGYGQPQASADVAAGKTVILVIANQ